ncbi:hypothetical protein BKA67DRAFT_574220 [Truncatella angustata]|uniref:CFEM domain-containing protein n=1 Tax=Truncatella angustata TaxID=152316 RepID=A0A9P8UE58_9PEZI|nr:uncharacterized protein BKA67DRAFT_574220 [Truncatella angustata]KAH6648271.1 hypothetical protein BKA67DRAFT_574220 [Truncatella angustata]
MDQLPTCALTCLVSAIQASSCSMADTSCQCTNQELNSLVETCVLNRCTLQEALFTKNITQTICGAPIRHQPANYLAISVSLMGIATVLVLTRLAFKRLFTSNGITLDDWLILLTWLACIPSSVSNHLLLMGNGLGRDIWTLPTESLTHFALGFWLMEPFYFFEVSVLKLSMIAFYAKIFPGKNTRQLLLWTAVFDVLFGAAFILVVFGQCIPLNFFWTQFQGKEGKCINIGAAAWSNAAVSVALDVWLLAIPLYQLRKLQLSVWKKVGVALMFCVGSFVTIISAIRFAALIQMQNSTNLTWDYYHVVMWSTVEVTVGIMCTCMPTMRLVLVRCARHIGGTTSQNYTHFNQDSKSGPGSTATWKSTEVMLIENVERGQIAIPQPTHFKM